ncbi:hypothetical protein P6F26_02795 [Roseibacterium sp. SDUM158017]|uniref:hypothetical protein n=1 Tax=Roseicyclus salinarum TaxID=3036773 RepID=UPI0024156668|nr:hypothetical protein [Roseibacterium sp. SDUM158017]MDG4647359.1 hypothetical protein [Roseibacterium sp. SDUM158017]
MNTLERVAENAYLKLCAGLVLLFTAAWEVLTGVETGLRAEHGILVFSAFHILKVLPELRAGLHEVSSIRTH